MGGEARRGAYGMGFHSLLAGGAAWRLGDAGSQAGFAGARGGATPMGLGPCRLTVNESEGSQEHDPGQPEGARTKMGRAARGITLGLGRRPMPRAPIPRLPPSHLLHRHRHCRAVRAHARGGPRARTPHPHRENTPFSSVPAHTWGIRPLAGKRSSSLSARAPPAG